MSRCGGTSVRGWWKTWLMSQSIYMIAMERVPVIADHGAGAAGDEASPATAMSFLSRSLGLARSPFSALGRPPLSESFRRCLTLPSRLYQNSDKTCRRHRPKPRRLSRQAPGCQEILRYIVITFVLLQHVDCVFCPDQQVIPGNIIVRQRGTLFHPGQHVCYYYCLGP